MHLASLDAEVLRVCVVASVFCSTFFCFWLNVCVLEKVPHPCSRGQHTRILACSIHPRLPSRTTATLASFQPPLIDCPRPLYLHSKALVILPELVMGLKEALEQSPNVSPLLRIPWAQPTKQEPTKSLEANGYLQGRDRNPQTYRLC